MPVIIPMKDFPSFSEEVTFDDTPYLLKFYYNARFSFWSVDFYTREGTLLLSGVRLILNYEILKQYHGKGLPEGELWVYNAVEDNYNEPTRDSFIDGDCYLVYYENS